MRSGAAAVTVDLSAACTRRRFAIKFLAHIRSRLTYANIVSSLCLFLVLGGGTAVALSGSNTVFSDDIRNGEVKRADVRANAVNGGKVADNSLRGRDVDESSFGRVPSAAQANSANSANIANTADTANELGGVPPDGYQKFCATGAVKRIFQVNGDAADFPTANFSFSSYFIQVPFSCRGDAQQAAVKKTSTGVYLVSTAYGDLSLHGVVNVDPSSAAGSGADNFANVRFVGDGDFEVVVRDADGAAENADFTLVLF